jgi:two-component system NtrC family response regulator
MAVRKDQRSQSSPVAAWLRESVEKDPALGRTLEQLQRVAAGEDAAVLVGARGCGLERAARAIHFLSRRALEPVLVVGCGELPEASAEAELFGFDGGGHPPRIGLLERAGSGTVVLRDIDALPVGAQRALARTLERGEFAPVNGGPTKPLQARIVATSHADLRTLAAGGIFNRELFDRLAAGLASITCLHEHPEDVPELARHLLDTAVGIEGPQRPRGFAPEAEEALRGYRWSGGLDELRECVQEAAARASGELIGVDDLPQHVRESRSGGTLEALEVGHIRRALEQAGGNQRRAARSLGISRWSLSRRLRKHGLRPAGEN